MSGSMLNITPQTQVVLNDTAPLSARILPFSLTLAAAPQVFSLQKIVNSKQMTIFQGMYVDNSQNATAANIVIGAQVISVPAFAQGTFPIFVTSSMTLAFSGNGTVNFVLTNFPLHPNVWQPNGQLLGDGDVPVTQRIGALYSAQLTTFTTKTLITGNPNCFITGILLQYFTIGSGSGIVSWVIKFQNKGVIANSWFVIPAAEGSATTILSLTGLNLLGDVSGDSVQVQVASVSGGANFAFLFTVLGGATAVT